MSGRFGADYRVHLSGHALVASPSWDDHVFTRSVVLIVHHSPDMAAGIILNRPASKLSPHLSTLFGSGNTLREVYLGGPHSGPVVAIHQQEAHSEYSPVQNVHFAAHIDNLKAVTRSAHRNLKIVVGQAQWPGGELDRQFETGAWLPLPLSEDLIFGDPEMLWPLAMRKVGNRFVASITGASVLPPSSLLN